MTPLQKSILSAVKRRPMTLRELQNNLQVDNSRLRTTVSAMVATGELSLRNGTYVPGFATYQNEATPNTIPCTLVKLAARSGLARPGERFPAGMTARAIFSFPAVPCMAPCPRTRSTSSCLNTPGWKVLPREKWWKSRCPTIVLPAQSA